MITHVPGLTDRDIESSIMNILAGQGSTERDFQLASSTYNSIFFTGLPNEFRQRACAALKEHFENYTNNFWNKFSTTAIQD